MTTVLERGSAWDYLPVEPSPQLPSPEAYAHTTVELAANTRTADELLASLAGCHHDPMVVQAAGIILAHLQNLPGDTWDARWAAFEAATARGPWRSAFSTASWADRSDFLPQAVGHLVYVDAFRPTLRWSNNHRMGIWATFAGWRDPDAMRQFRAQLAMLKLTQLSEKQVILSAGHLCAITGKTIRQLDLGDMLSTERGMHWNAKRFGRGYRSLFATLHALGWVEHSTGIYPQHGKRQGPQTIEQMVDRHHIRQPQRDVWVEYLKHRAAGLDHSTVQSMTYNLVGAFWKDIQDQHPDLETFAVDRQMIDGWRARMEFKPDGTVRRGLKTLVIQIRAFYLDIAQWSIGDAYWAQWAVACPISRSEVTKQQKHVRATTARLQQRTRDLAPLLPQIVDLAAAEKTRTTKALALAQASSHGDVVELEGQQWTVYRPNDTAQLQLRRDGKFRRVEIDEAIAFWTWAAVEVLRHTGIRIEEMLELTHLALQPYTVPSTRETIPLLHIAPAKTDVERMIVAGPELVHALAEILKRVRADDAVPLTQRWDHLEHVVSDPLPHLFVRPFVKELRVITAGTIRNHLIVLCRRAGLRINGEAVAITPHDFRRLFATEALAAGLPPHIVQVLLGHKSIATTQVYAAIYPQDVIRHHRAFISLRRQTRPTEEYREPTPAEWDEFEAFFVQRKVSLGSCGRAYGTSCHHEHACVRCALLRPDPAQAGRLRDIVDNLGDRIEEAEQHNWLGEAEGLRVSLAAAQLKLSQMEVQVEPTSLVELGMPTVRS